jgi:flagellar biosynthesis/type III secretory pathway M-ring protein FliF/YscJ
LRELTEEIPARSSLHYGDGAGTKAVRTRRWLCIHENGDTKKFDDEQPGMGSANELYVKPEDLWDVDNVASQHPEVVAELLQQVPENKLQRPGPAS